MGELIRKIKKFRFKGILAILLVFMAISSVLFVELSGVQTNRIRRKLNLLPEELVLTKAEVCETLPETNLLLRDSRDASSNMAFDEFTIMLDDMKVGYKVYDVAYEEIPDFNDYNAVIVLFPDLKGLGEDVITLCDWVYNGGSVMLPMTLESNAYSDVIAQIIGIDTVGRDYHVVSSIYLEDGFMIGGGKPVHLTDHFECARVVELAKTGPEIYARADSDEGIPLVWRTEYGKGIFVVDNIGVYDKAFRGFYAASYSLLFDVFAYPVINASVFYLDDFPSQIPSGNSEYIKRDYETTIRDFYINIWWPDMMNFGDRYGIKYTGLAIESYDDDVDGTVNNEFDTGVFTNFGNMLLRKGGELGYHGYNHQPLCFSNKDYKDYYDYKTWLSYPAMKTAFDELVEVCKNLFKDADFALYVPPSNLLSDEGRALLVNEYPQIKTISGIYFNDDSEDLDFVCTQEFGINEKDGIIDQPRVISGFILDEFQNIAAISELNFHYINSHFTHPDDALDPDRGAELGWDEMKRRFDNFL